MGELRRLLRQKVDPQLAELLVFNILKRDGLEAVWTAGRMERGADIVATFIAAMGSRPGWLELIADRDFDLGN